MATYHYAWVRHLPDPFKEHLRQTRGGVLVGDRRPTSYPTWVTLEVAAGGFATGLAMARVLPGEETSAAFLEQQQQQQQQTGTFGEGGGWAMLNDMLVTGHYTIQHPENAALLTVAWLLQQAEKAREQEREEKGKVESYDSSSSSSNSNLNRKKNTKKSATAVIPTTASAAAAMEAEAATILEAIAPYMDELRLHPYPSASALSLSERTGALLTVRELQQKLTAYENAVRKSVVSGINQQQQQPPPATRWARNSRQSAVAQHYAPLQAEIVACLAATIPDMAAFLSSPTTTTPPRRQTDTTDNDSQQQQTDMAAFLSTTSDSQQQEQLFALPVDVECAEALIERAETLRWQFFASDAVPTHQSPTSTTEILLGALRYAIEVTKERKSAAGSKRGRQTIWFEKEENAYQDDDVDEEELAALRRRCRSPSADTHHATHKMADRLRGAIQKRGLPGSPTLAAYLERTARSAAETAHARIEKTELLRHRLKDFAPDDFLPAGATTKFTAADRGERGERGGGRGGGTPTTTTTTAIEAAICPEESAAIAASLHPELPPSLLRLVRRTTDRSLEAHIQSGAVVSAEMIATVVPHLFATAIARGIQTTCTTAAADQRHGHGGGGSAGGVGDVCAQRLYALIFKAFARRRSLLLLERQGQVRMDELPWVRPLLRLQLPQPLTTTMTTTTSFNTNELGLKLPAGNAVIPITPSHNKLAGVEMAVRDVVWCYLQHFPATPMPNKLVRALKTVTALATTHQNLHTQMMLPGTSSTCSDNKLPLTEELATDIFTRSFSLNFSKAAVVACREMRHTVYAQYYGLEGLYAHFEAFYDGFMERLHAVYAAVLEKAAGETKNNCKNSSSANQFTVGARLSPAAYEEETSALRTALCASLGITDFDAFWNHEDGGEAQTPPMPMATAQQAWTTLMDFEDHRRRTLEALYAAEKTLGEDDPLTTGVQQMLTEWGWCRNGSGSGYERYSYTAENGRVIEAAMVITTHNLAQLTARRSLFGDQNNDDNHKAVLSNNNNNNNNHHHDDDNNSSNDSNHIVDAIGAAIDQFDFAAAALRVWETMLHTMRRCVLRHYLHNRNPLPPPPLPPSSSKQKKNHYHQQFQQQIKQRREEQAKLKKMLHTQRDLAYMWRQLLFLVSKYSTAAADIQAGIAEPMRAAARQIEETLRMLHQQQQEEQQKGPQQHTQPPLVWMPFLEQFYIQPLVRCAKSAEDTAAAAADQVRDNTCSKKKRNNSSSNSSKNDQKDVVKGGDHDDDNNQKNHHHHHHHHHQQQQQRCLVDDGTVILGYFGWNPIAALTASIDDYRQH